jgi:hypothetical protein
MIDLILYTAALVVAFWAGVHYAQIKFMFRIGKEPEKFIAMLEQIREINADEAVKINVGAPEDAVMLNTEERAGLVYLFQSEDDMFIAQGKSIEDALKSAAQRFPGKKFWIPTIKQDTQTT